MPAKKSSRKGLKMCCAATFILLLIFIVVAVTLFFTLLKPRKPEITAHPASLENIQIQIIPTFSLNATIGLVVTINNRKNYGSFKYRDTTANIEYRGTSVAKVPILHNIVPARGTINITTYANITGDELVTNPKFWSDVSSGFLNLTSVASMRGKVCVFKIFKLDASVFSTCDISVNIQTRGLDSKCNSKLKL